MIKLKSSVKCLCFLNFGILILLWCSCKKEQNGFEIKGNIEGLNASKAYLQVLTDSGFRYLDSVDVQGETFTLKGKIHEPIGVTLWVKEEPSHKMNPLCSSFQLENSKIRITGNINKRGEIVIEGSEEEVVSKKLRSVASISLKIHLLKLNLENTISADSINCLNEKIVKLKIQFVQAIKDNTDYYAALHTLSSNLSVFSVDELKQLATCFPQKMRSSDDYKRLVEVISNNPKVKIGDRFKSFSLKDSSQRIITNSQFKSKVLMVDFWASWCGPCRKQLKKFKELYAKTKRADFEIVGISLDEDYSEWKNALIQDKLPWINTISPGKAWVKNNFLITSIPYNFLLDSNGVIIAKNLSSEEVEKLLIGHADQK